MGVTHGPTTNDPEGLRNQGGPVEGRICSELLSRSICMFRDGWIVIASLSLWYARLRQWSSVRVLVTGDN
eukprot:1556826-Amphidinium_carterae.1